MAITGGDILQVKTFCFDADQVGINIGHFQVGAVTGGGLTETQVADLLSPLVAVPLKFWMHDACTYRGMTIQKIRPLPAGSVAISTVSAGPGSGGAEALPQQLSGLIHKVGSVSGRHGRGRLYIPFPPVAALDPSTTGLKSTFRLILDQLGLFWGNTKTLIAGSSAVIIFPVIYNRAAGTGTIINACTSDTKVATQRRRGAFGKTNPTPF